MRDHLSSKLRSGESRAVGVIDYRTGNSRSVHRALNFLGVPNRLLTSPVEMHGIDRLILPGVGSAGTTMNYLEDAGWPRELHSRVLLGGMPFLGVCVGLQVMFESSAEQDAVCLGWLPGTVRPFRADDVRVPQMGWNQVRSASAHPFAAAIPEGGYFYFVNSYFAEPAERADVGGVTTYGATFASVVARKNIMATQFHIEKSGKLGLTLLERFVRLTREELC